jgi:hypothetical protein
MTGGIQSIWSTHMPTLPESIKFLAECEEADSNVEETAVRIATAR